MTVKKTIYECSYCYQAYSTLKAAKSCEKECLKREKQKVEAAKEAEMQSSFPTYHEKDTRYKKHCVDCGKLLIEYEYVCTPVESYPGDCIYSDKSREENFGGLRCRKCTNKIKDILYEALAKKG